LFGRKLNKNIDDSEVIVRAIVSPFHVTKNKKRVIPAAFMPPYGIDEISVMRHLYLSKDKCKSKGQSLNCFSDGEFIGFAVLTAKDVRNISSEVVDSRFEYLGHADIKHGVILERDEPTLAAQKYALKTRLDTLLEKVKYLPDPNPKKRGWEGPEFNSSP
jgi:hypothetical protein